MVAGAVGALRAPQREQARPLPKTNTREPCNGRRDRRGATSTAARASPSSEAVETFPMRFWRRRRACSPPLAAPLQRPRHCRDPRHSRDPRHCRILRFGAIPALPRPTAFLRPRHCRDSHNAGGRRGAASEGEQARLSRLIPHPFLTARAGATHTSFKLDQAHAVGIDGGEGGKLVGGGCGREGHVRGLDSEARLLAHLLR